MANIITKTEGPRGCGFRKPGGTYLVADGLAKACGRLPLALTVCPCCNQGIKFSRAWTWIDPRPLFKEKTCWMGMGAPCNCTLSDPRLPEKAGLLWIGRRSYTPNEWQREAQVMGVSRRIATVPRGLEVGKTLVLVAHLDAIPIVDADPNGPQAIPGIFHAFVPTRIEYVVKGDETDEELDARERRGQTLVRVLRQEQGTLFPTEVAHVQ